MFVLFCFSPPTKRETLNGLFSTFRRKMYPPNAREYCIIVVLGKKINELSTVMIILQNDWESGGFRLLSD